MSPTPGWELRFSKWDGSTSKIIPLAALDSDRYGRWFRWPAGTAMTRPAGPSERHADDHVVLVPHDGSWIARWGLGGVYELYCDVTTRPVIDRRVVHAIDLDLDVVRFRTGRVALIDQEQFDERRVTFGYPAPLVLDAETTGRRLLDAVRGRREPFASMGAARLAPLSSAARSRLVGRLVDHHAGIGAHEVARRVDEAADGLAHARVRTHLPVLIERSVRRRLAVTGGRDGERYGSVSPESRGLVDGGRRARVGGADGAQVGDASGV